MAQKIAIAIPLFKKDRGGKYIDEVEPLAQWVRESHAAPRVCIKGTVTTHILAGLPTRYERIKQVLFDLAAPGVVWQSLEKPDRRVEVKLADFPGAPALDSINSKYLLEPKPR